MNIQGIKTLLERKTIIVGKKISNECLEDVTEEIFWKTEQKERDGVSQQREHLKTCPRGQ